MNLFQLNGKYLNPLLLFKFRYEYVDLHIKTLEIKAEIMKMIVYYESL
jgi:hypothetical protein